MDFNERKMVLIVSPFEMASIKCIQQRTDFSSKCLDIERGISFTRSNYWTMTWFEMLKIIRYLKPVLH